MSTKLPSRVFKTTWFTRAAKKARIDDDELCRAIEQVMLGQADDLGGGVFKKRLNDNMHRSIIVAKGGRCWVYTFLYAKKDCANISSDELVAFRKLAAAFAQMSASEMNTGLRNGDLLEICDGG